MNEKLIVDVMTIDIPVRKFKSKDESEGHYYFFPQLELTNKSIIKGYLWFDLHLDHDIYYVEPVLSTSNSYIQNPYLVIKANVLNPVMKLYLESCHVSDDFTEMDATWIGVDEHGRVVEAKPKELINSPDIVEICN